MQIETRRFYAYLTSEYLEIQSTKTNLTFKIWSKNFPKIPAYLMGEIKTKIEQNKKAKKEKTIYDDYLRRKPNMQIFIDLSADEAKLLYSLK